MNSFPIDHRYKLYNSNSHDTMWTTSHTIFATILATFLTFHLTPVSADCVWYDTCRFDGIHWQNCPYDGPGHPLDTVADPDAVEIIQRRCPEYYNSPDELLCCTAKSLRIMDDSIAYAESVYGRCPTCLKNLIRSICAFSCSPDASRFTGRHTRTETIGGNTVEYIHQIDVNVTQNYIQGVFDSCSNVIHPASGKKVLDIACGSYDSFMCDPIKWFTFMGDAASNTLAPFTINYLVNDVVEESFDRVTKPCDEVYEGDYQCSCVDCNLACPVGGEPEPEEEPFQILQVNGTSFLIGVIIGCLGVAYITIYFMYNKFAIRMGGETKEMKSVLDLQFNFVNCHFQHQKHGLVASMESTTF